MNFSSEDMNFFASLKKSNSFVSLNGNLNGNIKTDCYRCGNLFNQNIQIKLDFLINDGLYEGDNDKVMYEAEDCIIDIQDIFDSEMNMILSDYNVCKQCENIENDFHIDI